MNDQAEAIRKKYLYRRLIMRRKVALNVRSAAGLIGPDCAYHLYGQFSGKKDESQPPKPSSPDEMDADLS